MFRLLMECLGVAWLIGWSLILEYTAGGAAVARGISANLVMIFGGETSLPIFLIRHHVPGQTLLLIPVRQFLSLLLDFMQRNQREYTCTRHCDIRKCIVVISGSKMDGLDMSYQLVKRSLSTKLYTMCWS